MGRNTNHSFAVIAFGAIKVAAGIFLVWGQVALEEKGTFCGFFWPHNLHDLLAVGRTITLFTLASWLIYTGVWGTQPKSQNTHADARPD